QQLANADAAGFGEQGCAERGVCQQLPEPPAHPRLVERDPVLRVEPAQHLQQGRQVAGSHRAQHQRGVQRTAHACSPRNASRRASSQTSTPSSVALASFEPASAPATTNPVFFDTLPDTLAPRASSFAFASSRPIESSVPVITTVTPSSGP